MGIDAGNFTLTGAGNTAIGFNALIATTDGSSNTASGFSALVHNTSGSRNTATGVHALDANTTGGGNTATGIQALVSNTTGENNVAVGNQTAPGNTTGSGNTAIGSVALQFNTTGDRNIGIGSSAGANLTTGSDNIDIGNEGVAGESKTIRIGDAQIATFIAGIRPVAMATGLYQNTTGSHNTAIGYAALQENTSGDGNTAGGEQALSHNATGHDNTALGTKALGNSSGSNNIAFGSAAGFNLVTGSNNIYIGSAGVATNEDSTTRIGDPNVQTVAFIAGISGATSAAGVAVYVSVDGQLGTLTSSARFKDDIQDLGEDSEDLLKLRPVSFRYKPEIDPDGTDSVAGCGPRRVVAVLRTAPPTAVGLPLVVGPNHSATPPRFQCNEGLRLSSRYGLLDM